MKEWTEQDPFWQQLEGPNQVGLPLNVFGTSETDNPRLFHILTSYAVS